MPEEVDDSGETHHLLHLYGYQDIQTPTFEYFDVFRDEIETISSLELISSLTGTAIRWRSARTSRRRSRVRRQPYLKKRNFRQDFVISGIHLSIIQLSGRLKENTQLGAELIGEDSVEADAELIAMVVDSLKKVELKEFQVNIGHVDFLHTLMDLTGLNEEKKAEVYALTANRNYFGVEEILIRENVEMSVVEMFRILPELTGGTEALVRAAKLVPGETAKRAIVRLLKIYQILELYGAEAYVTFDLSMSGSYGYYSGIVFRAYTYGTGDAIVRGGRYDHLIAKFGKNTPSIGFAVIIDELLSALGRQKIEIETGHCNLIVYTDATLNWAVSLACDLREKGKCIELLKREPWQERAVYEEYGKRRGTDSLTYLKDDRSMEMVNLKTGETRVIRSESDTGSEETR